DLITRSFDSALVKRRTWSKVEPPKHRRMLHGLDEARQLLLTALHQDVRNILRCSDEAKLGDEDDAGPIKRPLPTHLLGRVPRGAGKTFAALAAIGIPELMRNRIAFLTPLTRTTAEALDRYRDMLPPGDAYQTSRVRHHKGRRQLCKSETHGPLAEQIESRG